MIFKRSTLFVAVLSLFVSGCGFLVGVDSDEQKDSGNQVSGDCANPPDIGKALDGYNIKSETTLSAGSCYRVNEPLQVGGDAHLTIEKGVKLLFAENTSMTVSGATMAANGTEDKPVVFTGTSQNPGWWTGVQIENSASSKNVLKHVTIEYGGSDETPGNVESGANLMFDNQRGNIEYSLENVTLRHSGEYGLYAESNVEFNSFKNNTLAQNKGAAGIVNAWVIDDLSSSTSFSENEASYVDVTGANMNVDEKHTWPGIDVPYRVKESISVSESGLTIKPGASFHFEENTGLTLTSGGPFVIAGSPDKRIAFRGTSKSAGFWKGIQIEKTTNADNKFAYVDIRDAGNDETFGNVDNPANIMFDNQRGNIEFALENVRLKNSAGYGLTAENNVEFDAFKNNTLTQNQAGAAHIAPQVINHLDSSSTFDGNSKNFVHVTGNQVNVDDSIVWPAIDVPYRVKAVISVTDGELTVNAGATFSFEEHAGITLTSGGPFKFLGEEGNRIKLTGAQKRKGFWKGIQVEKSTSADNEFKYTTLEYAGDTDLYGNVDQPANLMFDNQRGAIDFSLSNVKLSNSEGYGLYAEGNVVFDSFKNNTLTSNKKGAAIIHPWAIDDLDSSSTFKGNQNDYVHVWGGNLSLEQPHTWPAIDVPYRVQGDISVSQGELQIQPGATFAFEENRGLTFSSGGPFVVSGTSNKAIRFTGTKQNPGHWKGIQIESTTNAENIFEHAVIEYGGNDETFGNVDTPANLMFDNQRGSIEFALQNVELEQSGDLGLYIENNVTLTACKITVDDVGGAGRDHALDACDL